MLSRLLADHRVEIVARARAKALERLAPRSLADPCDDAVAASVDHLVGMLESSQERPGGQP